MTDRHSKSSKLPCWSDLSDEKYRDRVAEIVRLVEREAAEKRKLEGKSSLWTYPGYAEFRIAGATSLLGWRASGSVDLRHDQ